MISVRMNSKGYRWVKNNKDGRIKECITSLLEPTDAKKTWKWLRKAKLKMQTELLTKGCLNKLW